VLNQCRFNLKRRNELTTDLEHVIRAAGVDIVALLIAIILIARPGPGTLKRLA
jgi:hypothetical protein